MGQRFIITEQNRNDIISSHIKSGYIPFLTENEIRVGLTYLFESNEQLEKLKKRLEDSVENNFDENVENFTEKIVDDIPKLKGKEKQIESGISNIMKNKTNKIAAVSLISLFLLAIVAKQFKPESSMSYDDATKYSQDVTNRKIDKYDLNKDGQVDDYEIEAYSKYYVDSVSSSLSNQYDSDMEKRSAESGVKISNIRFVDTYEWDGNWKSIKFNYTNNTGKDIEAISFGWYDLKNVFDENVNPTYDGGYDDEGLRNGRTGSGTWDINSKGVKKGKVYVEKIVFKDGSMWKNQPNINY